MIFHLFARASRARQRCMRCGRVGFWWFGLGPGIPGSAIAPPIKGMQTASIPDLDWPTAVAKNEKWQLATWCLWKIMPPKSSKCSQQNSHLFLLNIESWHYTKNWCLRVLSRSKSLRPSRVVKKTAVYPQVAILYRKFYDQPSTFWAPYFNFRQAQVFCWCCSIQFKV